MNAAVAMAVAWLLGGTAHPGDEIGRRIADSAKAAQALQGPLDGTWTLTGARGRTLAVIQIGDPAGGGALQCAWRTPGGALGLAACGRRGRRLWLSLEGTAERVTLWPVRRGAWRGVARDEHGKLSVSLRKH